MKRAIPIAVSCLLTAAYLLMISSRAGGQASPTPIGPAPHIETPEPVYDFGTVIEGASVTHDFTIKNTGKADLVIGNVQTTCGCTVANSNKKTLRPGEQTQLPATLDTRHEKGRAVRRIDVFTNDPQTPDLALTMQGFIKVEAQAMPEQLSFDEVHRGTEQTREVAVNYMGKAKDFQITRISASNPNIQVTQQPGTGAAAAGLKVTVRKTMPVGPFADTIEISTNHRPISVPIYGRVVGDLLVQPVQVSFGIIQHGEGAMRIVRLTNSGPRPVAITGISSSNPAVKAQTAPITPGKQYKITLLLIKGTPDGQLRGQVVIKTDDPEQATLAVPFYGIIGSFKG